QLSPASVHQEQLRFGRHRPVGFAMLKRVPNFFADGSSARLAQDPHGPRQRAKALRQELDLGGFAPAFGPFEGDEKTPCGGSVDPRTHGCKAGPGWAPAGAETCAVGRNPAGETDETGEAEDAGEPWAAATRFGNARV